MLDETCSMDVRALVPVSTGLVGEDRTWYGHLWEHDGEPGIECAVSRGGTLSRVVGAERIERCNASQELLEHRWAPERDVTRCTTSSDPYLKRKYTVLTNFWSSHAHRANLDTFRGARLCGATMLSTRS